ncbi:MAG: DHHA1 domain-containing protein, partial [Eggerthellaceae bacterium]|nr:DHHA1 domain-containing protein [Eggerthellaceae bacterium]
SVLSLGKALRKLGRRATCLLAKSEPIEDSLLFLPGADELVIASKFTDDVEVFIGVDVPTTDRLGEAKAVHKRAKKRVTIDHHAVPGRIAELSYTDPDAASTTVLVWELLKCLGVSPDADMATCAYTGLMTDTGRFLFQNTRACDFRSAMEMVECGADPSRIAHKVYQQVHVPTLRLESRMIERMEFLCEGAVVVSWLYSSDYGECGATKADAEPLINTLRSIKGVHVACILKEAGGATRGSLRSSDDTDVSRIAHEFGGGGHIAAAGFTLYEPISEAIKHVEHRLEELC